MRKRMKRKRRRSGTSLVLLLATILPLAGADKKKGEPEPYGLVVGSVFREPGLALAHADVTLIPKPPPDGPPVKMKKMQTISDARGEFAFRVPAAAASYTVTVAAKGYQGEQKSVTMQGEGRVDVTFMLREESKK
jgi:hypothetical protein